MMSGTSAQYDNGVDYIKFDLTHTHGTPNFGTGADVQQTIGTYSPI